MAWMLLVLQLCLSGVLLIAATGKMLRPEEFLGALRLSHLPAALVRPLGAGVPAVEYGLAFALLVGTTVTRRIALGATAVLFAIFTGWLVWVLMRRLHIRCGCFGIEDSEIGRHSIARNSLLLAVAIGGFVLASTTTSPLPQPSAPLAITVAATGMGCVLLLVLRAALPGLLLTLGQNEAQRSGAQPKA